MRIQPVDGQAADMMNLLAEIYMQQRELTVARPFLDQALEIWNQLHKEDTLETAHTLILLGEWHQAAGGHDTARACYKRALVPLEHSAVPTHLDFGRVERHLATLT